PPCDDSARCTTGEPHWIVSAEDARRRFHAGSRIDGRLPVSGATRRPGFVTLEEWRSGLRGLGISASAPRDAAVAFAERVVRTEQGLVPRLIASGIAAGLLLLLGVRYRGTKWGRACARAAAGCPFALHFAGAPAPEWLPGIVPWVGAAFVPVPWTLAFTAAAVGIDQWAPSHWGDFSPLQGYFGSGIRFYGVGNEMLGIFLGALAVCVRARLRLWAACAGVGFFGASFLGADYGAVVAFGGLASWDVLAKVWSGWSTRRSLWAVRLGLSVVGGVAIAVGAAWIDSLGPWASHGGQAIRTAERSGLGPLVDIVVRKLAMNLEIGVRPATLAGVAGVVLVAWIGRNVLARRGPGESGPGYLAGAVAAGLVFNDSGVVVAAMAMLPALAMVPEREVPASSIPDRPK
ncbi:MAG: hypothetical protein ACKO5K_00960, partial [Armatimonadota bacterium]